MSHYSQLLRRLDDRATETDDLLAYPAVIAIRALMEERDALKAENKQLNDALKLDRIDNFMIEEILTDEAQK